MKPIGVIVLTFMYMMSAGYYLAEEIYLEPAGIIGAGSAVNNLEGRPINFSDDFLDRSFDDEDDPNQNYTGIAPQLDGITNSQTASGGDQFDQVLGFSFAGFQAVFKVIALATGSYGLFMLSLVGIPQPLIVVFSLVLSFVAVRTLIYFILGR